jgi:hypothetical protein
MIWMNYVSLNMLQNTPFNVVVKKTGARLFWLVFDPLKNSKYMKSALLTVGSSHLALLITPPKPIFIYNKEKRKKVSD